MAWNPDTLPLKKESHEGPGLFMSLVRSLRKKCRIILTCAALAGMAVGIHGESPNEGINRSHGTIAHAKKSIIKVNKKKKNHQPKLEPSQNKDTEATPGDLLPANPLYRTPAKPFNIDDCLFEDECMYA